MERFQEDKERFLEEIRRHLEEIRNKFPSHPSMPTLSYDHAGIIYRLPPLASAADLFSFGRSEAWTRRCSEGWEVGCQGTYARFRWPH